MRVRLRDPNLLLAAGLFTLFSWLTRAYTWYANDLQSEPYLALLHFPIILIFLVIGGYITHLGVRGRRAS